MDIYKLLEQKEKKYEYKEKLFKKVLQQVHRRIEIANDHSTVFTIPTYVFGYPLVNPAECADFLISELTMNGFKVRCCNDRYLFINWKHIHEEYSRNKILNKNLLEYKSKKKEESQEQNIKNGNNLILNNGTNAFSLLR